MYPHRIRLRGPWECQPLAPTPGELRRVTMPGRLRDVGFAGHEGRLRLVRKFGYPGRIDAFERVWLTFTDLHGPADLKLNDAPIAQGVSANQEIDVTSLLKTHNQLEITLRAESDDCVLFGEVALEIRCQVFLRNVRAEWTGKKLTVTGQAVGQWPESLDLYIMPEGAETYFMSLRTADSTTSFSANLDLDRPGESIRIELVEGASVWFRVDLPMPSRPAD